MEDESEYTNLPTEEMCVHKLWKARVMGYEKAAKLFKQIDDDKSSEWNKYLGLIKKFVSDSNAMAQEKGLEAALAFIENCSFAGKIVADVMSNIVAKCIAAPKTKTKDLALQVTLMCFEIEKHEATQEELMKGMEHKNPKITSACISAITTALKQFGNKVVSIKLLVKKIPTMLTDRDKDVRTEGKTLVVEMHRWIGPALEPHISQLQAVMLQELRDSFADAGGKAVPERYLRSQQVVAAAAHQDDQNDGDGDEADGGDEDDNAQDVDPYELLDPVDILSKIPKDFTDKLDAKKWQDRKEALEALENLLKAAPKLEPGDYGEVIRAMKKVISKDSNVLLVALAGKCVALLATGLKKHFNSQYVSILMSVLLDKFKEKKSNVVTALREAVDAIYPCTTIEAIMEDVVEALNNKNPQVKAETAAFLARAFARTQPTMLTKKLLKVYVPALLKVLESADPTVRDQAAEALGTAYKLVGEKNISPFVGKLDNLKEQKIQECCEKAVILVKVAAPKKEARPKTAPSKTDGPKAGSAQPKPVKRPTTAAAKKPAAKKVVESSKNDRADDGEREMCQDDVDAKAEELLGAQIFNDLSDSNWKVRLEAVQNFADMISSWSPSDVSAQVLVRTLNKKPGIKDNNIQSCKMRLETIKTIASSFPISTVCVDQILSDIVERLSDAKSSQIAGEVLISLSEATNLEYVALQALDYAMDKQKNPRVQTEIFDWLTNALTDFGLAISPKPVLNHIKKALAATNPSIRTSAMTLLGTLYTYLGQSLFPMLDSVKIQMKPQMKQEIEKYGDVKPPVPIRGVKKSASKGSFSDDGDVNGDEHAEEESAAPSQDTRVRVDITTQITDALITEINDKNWKVRIEALEKIKNIITNAHTIKPNIGELPPALALRLVDSNSKIAQLTFQICELMVTAMGPKGKVHVRTFFPGFFQGLGDSKTWIRTAALQCINEWVNQCGIPSIFEGEMVFDALKSGTPILKAELWNWLAEKLPPATPKTISREELLICIPLLYAALEDRSVDVRKGAGEAVLGFMMHLGNDTMTRQAEKLKPGSKSVVQAALDKARPNMPIQPLSKTAESKTVKSGGAQAKQGAAQQKSAGNKIAKGIAKTSSASSVRSKNKDEDLESNMPLLPVNNIKHQRIIDEQKLKVLKWNFVTPREEFFDLLKDQMATGGVNKSLISNMFHVDFRYHIKAIESLMDDLGENGSALISNLDLIFKWLTLRFFDTNPSVLLKGLEYLNSVFTFLINENYQLAEYEAQCFIPYLVLKVGDPKDTVRNGVKSLLKQICVVYPVNKLFGYLMEGLKSKNARQRTECLDVLGLLIESFGVAICNPSPAAALKEIAKQISDRDNSVRNAALNCVVQAYHLEGERVYKMIGQISDKDLSLLEERIKRAAKTRDPNRKTMLITTNPVVRPNQVEKEMKPAHIEDNNANEYEEEDDPMNDYPLPPTRTPPKPEYPQRPVSGIFGLDPTVLASIESDKVIIKKPNIQEVDLAFLDEPTVNPSMLPGPHIMSSNRPITNVMPLSPPSRLTMQSLQQTMLSQQPPSQSLLLSDTAMRYEQDNVLSRTIQAITSPNLTVCVNALSQMEGILKSNRANLMSAYEEQLLLATVEQFKRLQKSNAAIERHELFSVYSYLISVLGLFYEGKIAGRNATSVTLGALIDQLLRLLISRVLEREEDDNLVRAVNALCVKMLEKSDHTALVCALVTLLQNSVSGEPSSSRYQELAMKCLWKVIKMMPEWESDSVNYDQVLSKLHEFFKLYPSGYWKKNSHLADTPFRTIKTFAHSLLKKKGRSILNHTSLMPDFNDSELHHYLLKLLKMMTDEHKKDDNQKLIDNKNRKESMLDKSPMKMPRLVHEELTQILKRISTGEHSKEALSQLYDLKERHPNVDILVCMKNVSNVFRTYIEEGLKKVAEERRAMHGDIPRPMTMPSLPLSSMAGFNTIPTDGEGELSKNHMHHLERLRALQAKAGMMAEASSNSQPRTPIIDSRSMMDSMNDGTRSIDPKFDLPTLHQQPSRREPQMEALRQKLQEIKSANR